MQCTLKTDVTAIVLGIGLLSAGTVAVIGAGGFLLWMLGVH